MTRSMTGYGRSEAVKAGLDITVELKSVNHRYFEFSAKTPRGYGFIEDKLKAYVQSRVSRGKIDLFVTITCADETPSEVELNLSLAAGYVDALKRLSSQFGLRDDISVSNVSRFPDIFTVKRSAADEEEVTAAVLSVAEQAVDRFISMRELEGEKLRADVIGRSETILGLVTEVERRSPETVEEYKTRLKERIVELAGDVKVDEQRLLTEIAIFADKVAVAEETVRLRSHFDQLFEMMELDIPIGRKLDFLLQEMNREANTIGSKAQDAQLAHIVVDIKAELEKIREQIQNIE